MLFLPISITDAKNRNTESIKLVIKTTIHSKYKSSKTIESTRLLHNIKDMKYISNQKFTPISDAYLIQTVNGEQVNYLIDENYHLFDIKTKKVFGIPKSSKFKMKKNIHDLRKKHYGKLLPWEKVNTLIPKYSKFEIIDLDSGAIFQVQRRAGSNHADVQPLSRKDTKIMKEVYHGKWSWKRRAIIIDTGDERIAASMHGMPHGQGALINGFPGHFCVHFHLSKTHKRNSPDFAHNLMTLKAAGMVKEFYQKVTPNHLIDSFILAIHQQDPQLMKLATTPSQFLQAEQLYRQLENVRAMKRMSFFPEMEDNNQLFLRIPIEVSMITDHQYEKKTVHFLVYRGSYFDSWKLDIKAIAEQL